MRNVYNEYKNTIMHFGKYKGIYLKDIPTNYIEWVVMNHTDRGVCEMCAVELQRRNPSLRK
jgi:uncharacterized protein (DUF3820 family)